MNESYKTGFRAEILEKVIRLLDLLNAFSDDDYLKPRMALKGGTALNLFHFDVPRLSVDIDLNYIGSIERETMLLEKPKILEAIEKICKEKKYRHIRKPVEHAGGKWIIGYKSELVQQGQLEIDLNFISRVSLWPVMSVDSKKIGTYQAKSISVLDYHDLIGGKLSALFSRQKSRDVFDVYTIFENPEKFDCAKVRLSLLIYGASAKIDLRKITLDHINFDPYEMKNMLLPVLRITQFEGKKSVPWSEKLISTCKHNLADLITFRKNELDFLTRVLDDGEIIPELITQDEKLIDSIKKHPVLLWKCIKVLKYKHPSPAEV